MRVLEIFAVLGLFKKLTSLMETLIYILYSKIL